MRPITLWLFLCLFTIALMIGVGGLTRLTESGLSITEWNPVFGIVPPSGDEAWEEAFLLYKQSPEYQKQTYGMTMEKFQSIYWMEFIHRLIGRVAGVIFLLPLLCFWLTKTLSNAQAAGLFGIFALGGAQGVIGWLMVKSGLIDRPMVSPYWLMTHLLTAFVIYALIFWQALRTACGPNRRFMKLQGSIGTRRMSIALVMLLLVQIALGALVAGWDAGLMFNTFPTMEGKWIPEGVLELSPWYKNLGENPTTIQWLHRVMAVMVLLATTELVRRLYREPVHRSLRLWAIMLIAAVLVQIALGACTLMFYVPVALASIHQLWALVLYSLALFLVYRLHNTSEPTRTRAP